MIIHQLSVFLENNSLLLTEVPEDFGEENIRITAKRCEGKANFVTDKGNFKFLNLL